MTTAEGKIAERLMERLDALAAHSDEPGLLSRPFLSSAHATAAGVLREWMAGAGLIVRLDAAGTLQGWLAGADPDAPALLLGSHVDTVRDAGRYDGTLGVLAALAAIELLRAEEWSPRAPVALLAFGDEEGVRWPVTLTGSRALAGILDIPTQLSARDADGIALGDALDAFGGDAAGLAAVALDRSRVRGFLEVHIEQGPVLEREALPLGIVTAINGASRFRLEVMGRAGHAGTVPMAGRSDALAAAAEMIVAIRREGLARPGITATVGRMEIHPGAVNVIPGRAAFTLDLRAPEDAARADALSAIEEALSSIADEHGVSLEIVRTHDSPAAPCDPVLQDVLAEAVEAFGVRPRRLPSGAGHDAMAMAALCPMAMLFVRCRGGISHNPAESIEAEDAWLAVRVLAEAIRRLAG
ncbi:allantoate amidohydrolase [Rhizosaccharibacter radicis]|uniref:Allantoate amidohydrolase n=1 Tax=Rhizosaccharibacter radicis TaxID=2782605 RepID=A0ABT1VWC7_9PROT|nr:allantoate amidohydrolase [Acetobacteraceae bacterium KSS12]